jgi:hypothetical protein
VNAADSALNAGQNIAYAKGSGGRTALSQFNGQQATNVTYQAQAVENRQDASYQANSLASVSLADSAQAGLDAFALANAADSAVNAGQNIAAGSGRLSLSQYNTQSSYNSAFSVQEVENNGIYHQSSNNGSVQLAGGQQGASGLMILNAASSAVNAGQNVASATASSLHDFEHANSQWAESGTTTQQEVEAYSPFASASMERSANNASVQATGGAQNKAEG